jgi:hypothetical protein
VNVGVAGRAYPVKWRLKDANGTPIQVLSAVTSITRLRLTSCSGVAQDSIEETVSASTSELKFDTGTGMYQYNWKTEKADAGCRRLVIELADGTRRTADFLFR